MADGKALSVNSRCIRRESLPIQQAMMYWTQDKATKRNYLFGQVRVTNKLVEEALDAGYHRLIETNKIGAFKACGDYLRKLDRINGDIFQRLIWQEHRNMNFIAERRSFEFMLADHNDYMEAIA